MKSATLDTNMIIWGLKNVASQGQEDRIERAVRLLQELDDQKVQLVLTSQVVAEYLAGFPQELREDQYRLLAESFPILSFDMKAAAIAASLLHKRDDIRSIQSEYDVTRQVVKADIAIVASAAAAGIDYIYSNDGKVRQLAQGLIIPKDLPSLRPSPASSPATDQRDLFGSNDRAE